MTKSRESGVFSMRHPLSFSFWLKPEMCFPSGSNAFRDDAPCSFLGSSRVKWWRRKTSGRWGTKEQGPSTSRNRLKVENPCSAAWAPENQLGPRGPGVTSAPNNGVSQPPRPGFPAPAARRPPSHRWLGVTIPAPLLAFSSKLQGPVTTVSTQWGRREQILSIWNSHFCFCTGDNALWTLQVKLMHQDNFSGSFWPLDLPEYCHHSIANWISSLLGHQGALYSTCTQKIRTFRFHSHAVAVIIFLPRIHTAHIHSKYKTHCVSHYFWTQTWIYRLWEISQKSWSSPSARLQMGGDKKYICSGQIWLT